jgi:hypothetical protein
MHPKVDSSVELKRSGLSVVESADISLSLSCLMRSCVKIERHHAEVALSPARSSGEVEVWPLQ